MERKGLFFGQMTTPNVSFKSLLQSKSLKKSFSFRNSYESFINSALFFCAVVSIFTTIGIIFVLFRESIYSFGKNIAFFERVSLKNFLFDEKWTLQFTDQQFGVYVLVIGTLKVAFIAAFIALPIGLTSAIYLSEAARPKYFETAT